MIKDERIRLLILLLAPFAFILIAVLAGKVVKFKPELTTTEKDILGYTTEVVALPEKPSYALSIKHDPFEYVLIEIQKPLKAVQTGTKTRSEGKKRKQEVIKLSLTIIGRYKKLAVINGLTFKEGDTYKGYLIKEIKPDSVILSKNGTKRIIFLEE